MKSGPGLSPHSTSAASNMAVVPDPGMPSVKSGTSAPPGSELLAPSGAATPSITPLPNCSPRGDTPFSTPSDKNHAIVEHPPRSAPTRKPPTAPFTQPQP